MRLRFALKKNPNGRCYKEEEEKGVVVPRGIIMVLLARALLKEGVFFDRLEERFIIVRARVLFLLRNARIFLVGIKSQQRGRGVF